MSNRYFKPESWSVTEGRYEPELNRFMETIFFLGNGYLGLRGTPEEGFSGEATSPTNFVAPVYDLVPQRPDYLVTYVTQCSVNVAAPNWFGVEIKLGGIRFDPRDGRVSDYARTLDLKRGTVTRRMIWQDRKGRQTSLTFTRFVSMDDLHAAAMAVEIRPLDWSGKVEIRAGIDAAVAGGQPVTRKGGIARDGAFLCTRTVETKVDTVTAMRTCLTDDRGPFGNGGVLVAQERTIARSYAFAARKGRLVRFEKFVAVCTSRDADRKDPKVRAVGKAAAYLKEGYGALHARHSAAWERIWREGDVIIEGDAAAQQGIRFCILNMHQNYSGKDPLVNMAAKGLSGPGYGGLFWWDSEIYMMPFFLYNTPQKARSLVLYRYLTLAGARKKAKVFGYLGAMYPWVTIDGEERSGDWQYGMLEQHVSAAVAHAIRQYVEGTGDEEFLWNHGAEMLVETSRFWASRVNASPGRDRYVINFITGPDEYTVGVNNNCYCNFMAMCNLEYGLDVVRRMKRVRPQQWKALARKLRFRDAELKKWQDVVKKIHIPFDRKLGIHEQDDSFTGRDPFIWKEVPAAERPVGQRWMWNRLMRSQAIKQADVLLLMLLQHDRFTKKQKRANYRYYEPKTTHESSLSPCVHSIMAAELGFEQDAFNYYLRTARLDLDDVNGNADQGLHIACTAGAWASIVNGMAGMRQGRAGLSFSPHLPKKWKRLAFAVSYRNRRIHVEMRPNRATFSLGGAPLTVAVAGKRVALKSGIPLSVRVD